MIRSIVALTFPVMIAAASSTDSLAWLAGDWATTPGATWTEEHWSPPRGGILLGSSRSGKGDTLREFEFLRIAPGPDGRLTYIAQPGGRPPVAFTLVASNASSATFENPAHDFPQRIVYRRDGDSLIATISRADGSKAMTWTYWRR